MLTENTLERSNNVCLSACLVFRTFLIFPLGLSWKANPGKQSSVFASPDQSPKNALPLRPFMIQPPLTRVAVEQLQLLGQQQCSFQCSHPRCWFLYRKPRLSKNMVTDNCANCRAITPNYRRFTPNYRAITPRSRDDKTLENCEQLDCHDFTQGWPVGSRWVYVELCMVHAQSTNFHLGDGIKSFHSPNMFNNSFVPLQ